MGKRQTSRRTKFTAAELITQARDAIAKGASHADVVERLRRFRADPERL